MNWRLLQLNNSIKHGLHSDFTHWENQWCWQDVNKKTSSSVEFVFLDFNQCNKVVWGIFYTSSFLENILILHFVFTDVAISFFQRFLASLSLYGEVNTDRIYISSSRGKKKPILLLLISRQEPIKINKGNSFVHGFYCLEKSSWV